MQLEWYVKTESGNVYGPATINALVEWAKTGRIEPSDSVSSDRVHWIPAPYKQELEMKWIVEIELGKLYGPFNHAVISRLINEKTVPPNARIYRLYDGVQEGGALVVREAPKSILPTPPREGFVDKLFRPRKKSIFDGADPRALAALEAAARRELAAARGHGIGMNGKLFGGR